MRYPTLGAGVPAFVLSYDVEAPEGESSRMAPVHLQSGLKQFPDVWLKGVRSALTTKLARKLVIVGGLEARYPGKNIARPDVIKSILCDEGDIDAGFVDCVVSEPNTIGNAEAIAQWCHEHQYDHEDGVVVCAYWHAPRASLDLRLAGIDMPVIPGEAIWLAAAATESERASRRMFLAHQWGEWGRSDFMWRCVMECNGIADKLCRQYESLSDRPTKAPVAAA